MSMALKAYVPEIVTMPEGDHKVKVKSVEEIVNQFAKPTDPAHRQKQFKWTLEDEKVEGIAIMWTGTALTDKSNLLSWVEAVLNWGHVANKKAMEELDLESLVGKEVMVRIENKTDSKGNQWAKVTKWWPVDTK